MLKVAFSNLYYLVIRTTQQELKVIGFAEHNYTNVNIATPEGISRALNLGLVPSHLADTVVSSHVDLIPSLFNANDKARAFVLFRHPVDRASSMFYFLKGTGYPPMKNMTIDDYAKSELIENNWLGEQFCCLCVYDDMLCEQTGALIKSFIQF